jgi:hypothetical protein
MSLRNNETSVEIVSMLESLCKKLSELSGKKIGFDTEVHKLHGSADPTTVHHILSNMLQNALAHGTGEIEVTVEINGCVRVWNKADREIGFTLIGGQLLDGELPTVSTTSTGSGTGLRSILEACNASRGALSFSMHNAKNGIVTELNLQEFSIPEQETDIATREPTVPFGMISFICHDNDPRSTFSKNEKICPAGHAFRYLDCPNSLLRGSGNMAEDLTRFIALNHAELSRTSLCVLHMNTLMIDALIEPLQELYPHITFLPASHEPAGLDTYLQRLAIKGRIPSHVLLPQVIEGSVQPNDAATEKQVRDSLFGVTFTRGVFETILAIAQRAAEKNAVTQK